MTMGNVHMRSRHQAACCSVCGAASASFSYIYAVRFYTYCFFYYFIENRIMPRKGIA